MLVRRVSAILSSSKYLFSFSRAGTPQHDYRPLAQASTKEDPENPNDDLEPLNPTSDGPDKRSATPPWLSGCLRPARDKVSIRTRTRRCRKRRICRIALATTLILFIVLLILALLFSPYSKRPPHYSGTNPSNETVFIAVNIINEALVRGSWGQSILELVQTIGPENSFLSIYENDSGPSMTQALQELAEKVQCEYSIVSGHVDTGTFPTVQVLPGEQRIKRLAYLAHVRNQALRPLDQAPLNHSVEFNSTDRHFDKLLFLNDVVFSAADAADLLFATNIGPDGRTDYHAACAMDFDRPFKFYDRFALRDAEFYRVGLPLFPWFTTAGNAQSWKDVMNGVEAVPVQSCWGGMVAFEAQWFQSPSHELEPLRFRYESELFWDASECCLIHADLSEMAKETAKGASVSKSGIYVNPHVRVAYDDATFSWLNVFRHIEWIFTLVTFLVDAMAGLPGFCSRRLESPGEEVAHRTWIFDGPAANASLALPNLEQIPEFGHWETITDKAKPGGYCGYDMLLAWKANFKPGVDSSDTIHAPIDRGEGVL